MKITIFKKKSRWIFLISFLAVLTGSFLIPEQRYKSIFGLKKNNLLYKAIVLESGEKKEYIQVSKRYDEFTDKKTCFLDAPNGLKIHSDLIIDIEINHGSVIDETTKYRFGNNKKIISVPRKDGLGYYVSSWKIPYSEWHNKSKLLIRKETSFDGISSKNDKFYNLIQFRKASKIYLKCLEDIGKIKTASLHEERYKNITYDPNKNLMKSPDPICGGRDCEYMTAYDKETQSYSKRIKNPDYWGGKVVSKKDKELIVQKDITKPEASPESLINSLSAEEKNIAVIKAFNICKTNQGISSKTLKSQAYKLLDNYQIDRELLSNKKVEAYANFLLKDKNFCSKFEAFDSYIDFANNQIGDGEKSFNNLSELNKKAAKKASYALCMVSTGKFSMQEQRDYMYKSFVNLVPNEESFNQLINDAQSSEFNSAASWLMTKMNPNDCEIK